MTRSNRDEASLNTLCDLIALARDLSKDLPGPPGPGHQDLLRALSAAHLAALRLCLEMEELKAQQSAP